MKRTLTALALMSVAIACTTGTGPLLEGDDSDTRRPIGGGVDSGGPDATPTTPSRDAGEDGPVLDTFCTRESPKHVFCCDFDQKNSLDGIGWSFQSQVQGGKLALDETTHRSSPRALRITVPSGGAGAGVDVLTPVKGPSGRVVLGADVRHEFPDLTDDADRIELLAIAFGKGGVALRAKAGGWEIRGYTQGLPGPEYIVNVTTPIPRGVWVRLVLDASFRTTNDGAVKLTMQNPAAGGTPTVIADSGPRVTTSVEPVPVGAISSGPHLNNYGTLTVPAAQAHYDNVTADTPDP